VNVPAVLPRVALVTCAEIPDVDTDSRRVIDPLTALGIHALPAVWDDGSVDWGSFDLAVVRSCWDYVPRRREFLAWADQVPRLANPAGVLWWNTEKRYLLDLQEAGVPIVPTDWVRPSEWWEAPDEGEWVIKPSVSLSSMDTGRYRMRDAAERRLAVEHMRRLQADDRLVMVQPYMSSVEGDGETSLIYFGRTFSHAVRKSPVLNGPDLGIDHRFDVPGENPRPRVPTDAQLALAREALAAIPGGWEQILFARVDLIPDQNGRPMLMELELTEPQLFLEVAPDSAARFADAIALATPRMEPSPALPRHGAIP
jgi:hypothetical protein